MPNGTENSSDSADNWLEDEDVKDRLCWFDQPEALLVVGGMFISSINIDIQDLVDFYICLRNKKLVQVDPSQVMKGEKVVGALMLDEVIDPIRSGIYLTYSNDPKPNKPLPYDPAKTDDENKHIQDAALASWAVHNLEAGGGVHIHPPPGRR